MTTTREVPQVVKDLQAARDYLATHGWLQDRLATSDGSVCAVGAIQYGAKLGWYEESDRFISTVRALERAVNGDDGPRGYIASTIIRFNNTLGRTKKEVLAIFDKAIANELGVPQLAEVR